MSIKSVLPRLFSIVMVLALMLSHVQPSDVQAQDGDGLQRQVNAESGRVSFISPGSGSSISAARVLGKTILPPDPALALAVRYAPEFGLQDAERNLSVMKSSRSQDGQVTVRFQQSYEGIPVLGGELIVNTNDQADLYSISGEVSPGLSLSTRPAIGPRQAGEMALGAMAKWYEKPAEDFVATDPELWIFDESLLQASTRPVELTWRMEVTSTDGSAPVRELILVNAQNGGISLHFNQVDTYWSANTEKKTTILPSLKTSAPTSISSSTEPASDVRVSNSIDPAAANLDGNTWYVATTGSDTNSCSTVASPCGTINGAMTKAASGDTIKVALGTYLGSGIEVVDISNSLTLSGGWNSSYTSQTGRSIIDGQGVRRGIYTTGAPVLINSFTIQNGFDGGQGGGLYNYNGTLTLTNSVVAGNISNLMGGGISNFGTMTVNNSEIRANTAGAGGGSGGGGGGGIENYSGTLTLNNSSVNNNTLGGWFSGSGIHAYGTVNINNSTISNNRGGYGEGIYTFVGTISIKSSTISGNQSYGFTSVNGYVTLANTIVAGNGGLSDCFNDVSGYNGTVTSQGYNLIGNPANCTFTPVTGDQVNVNAKLGPLVGSPGYVSLLPGSPATDAGNPAVPGSGATACPATDIRGVARPVGAKCDIGAYEYRATGVTPAYMIAYAGTPQSIMLGSQALSTLKTAVLDGSGDSVPGKTVTYTAPASGASVIFSNTGTNVSTAPAGVDGIAVSSGFSTNKIAGKFSIQATVDGLADAAIFEITNGGVLAKTYTANDGYNLPGAFLCDQSSVNCTNRADQHADTAHRYAMGTYDLYLNQHGRISIDGHNLPIISTVHYGYGYENAFWNGSQMVYGDGYGFPLADDVVAHELTHGVTQYESNLFYYYQSGAINESFSDLWGEYLDQTNGQGYDDAGVRWLLGEDVTGLGAMRNMSNPAYFYDPDRMTSPYYHKLPYYDNSWDNGGVHTNSGVNNKAVSLMVDGGSFNGKTITGLGWAKVGAIYYEVNTNLLTSGADYSDLYYALQQACSESHRAEWYFCL